MSARAKRGGSLPRVWDSPLTIAVIIVGARVARQPLVRLTRDFYRAVPLHVLLNPKYAPPDPVYYNGSLQGRQRVTARAAVHTDQWAGRLCRGRRWYGLLARRIP